MNLRKDHSHTSTYFTVNFLCELLYGGWGVSRTLVHQFAGSGAALEMLPLLWSYRYLCTTQMCLPLFLRVVSGPSFFEHNFQRRMSRLEQRWRAQRSVISIVNCRIPWTNRDLNVYCAFGLFLKACLLQCLLIFMPLTHAKSLGAVMGACLCVKEFCPWRIEYTGSVTSEQLNKHSLCLFCCIVVDSLPALVHSSELSFKTWS